MIGRRSLRATVGPEALDAVAPVGHPEVRHRAPQGRVAQPGRQVVVQHRDLLGLGGDRRRRRARGSARSRSAMARTLLFSSATARPPTAPRPQQADQPEPPGGARPSRDSSERRQRDREVALAHAGEICEDAKRSAASRRRGRAAWRSRGRRAQPAARPPRAQQRDDPAPAASSSATCAVPPATVAECARAAPILGARTMAPRCGRPGTERRRIHGGRAGRPRRRPIAPSRSSARRSAGRAPASTGRHHATPWRRRRTAPSCACT